MRRTILLSFLSVFATGVLFATNAVADSSHMKGDNKIKVNLQGFEEVPVTVSSGSGELQLVINDAAGTIAYNLSYENLEGDVTQAHIHIGQRNVAGGIALWLCQTTTNPAPPAAGTKTTTTFCGAEGGKISLAAMLAKFESSDSRGTPGYCETLRTE